MAFSAQTAPPKSITLSAFKDPVSGFFYIPFGPVNIWFGSGGVPTHAALAIGDLALNATSGIWYAATDIASPSSTWGVLTNV